MSSTTTTTTTVATATEPTRDDLLAENVSLRIQLDDLRQKFERCQVESNEAQRIKADFLANMSHELRTPLNAVLGISQMLQSTRLTAEQSEYVGMIRDSGKHLLTLINDVLDFSEMDVGQFKLEPRETSLLQVVEYAIHLTYSSAMRKGLDLHFWIDPTMPSKVLIDPIRVQKLLLNLLSNAIKFTEQGEIELLVGLAPGEEDSTKIEISVRDTGLGMSPDELDHVFQAFAQAPGVANKHGGSGLGLTICKYLATAMGGSIRCESSPGTGSTFFVNISGEPLDRTIRHDLDSALPAPLYLQGSRILIVSSQRGSALMWARLLRMQGSRVDIEHTLPDAVKLAETLPSSSSNGTPFDIMLLDGDNQLEPLATSRFISGDSPENELQIDERISDVCQVLVVFTTAKKPCRLRCLQESTGHSSDGPVLCGEEDLSPTQTPGRVDRQPTRPSVCDEEPASFVDSQLTIVELAKPIKWLHFLAEISAQLCRARHSRAAAGGFGASFAHQPFSLVLEPPQALVSMSPPLLPGSRASAADRFLERKIMEPVSFRSGATENIPVQYPLRILIVDDNTINQKVLAACLGRLGYNTDTFRVVSSGQACLDFLAVATEWVPDTIFMDISMSPMDGFECTRRVRQMQLAPQPWVIAHTATVLAESKRLCMDAYLSKPIQMQQLAEALKTAFGALNK